MIKSKTLPETKSILDLIQSFFSIMFGAFFCAIGIITSSLVLFLLYKAGYFGLANALYIYIGLTVLFLVGDIFFSLLNSFNKKCQQKNN
jgi:hypothetical protein